MKWLNILFEHDYERDGLGLYDPRQRGGSLFKCMLIWVGVNLCVDVVTRLIFDRSTSPNVYSQPWLLLIWMSVGALMWWVAKIHYVSWIAKRSESSISVVSRASSTEKEVKP